MSLDIIARLDELSPNPGCAYEAIESIIHTCEVPENALERTQLAVKLALCQFSVTGIEFPTICHNLQATTECTRLLETKSTWWTTFSGEYQHITQVCQEYRPRFESNKILNIFKNASTIFIEFQNKLRSDLTAYDHAKNEAQTHILFVNQRLKKELEEVEQRLNLLIKKSEDSHSELTKISQLNTAVVHQMKHEQAQLDAMLVATNFISMSATKLQDQFLDFSYVMEHIQEQHQNMAEYLYASVNHTGEVLHHADVTLAHSTTLIRTVSTIFDLIAKLSSPVGFMSLVSILLLRLRIRKKPSENPTYSHDVIFY